MASNVRAILVLPALLFIPGQAPFVDSQTTEIFETLDIKMPRPALKRHKSTPRLKPEVSIKPETMVKSSAGAETIPGKEEMELCDEPEHDQFMLMADEPDDAQFDEPPPVEANAVKPISSDVDLLPSKPGWRRNAAPTIDPKTDPIVMMQMDAFTPPQQGLSIPAVIHLFGLTETGNSVLLRVHGFYHFFYVSEVIGVSPENLKTELNKRFGPDSIRNVEKVTKRSIMYFIPGDPEKSFYKITVTNPRTIRDAAAAFESGKIIVEIDNGTKRALPPRCVFEATLDYILRFMIGTGLVGCSWITIPAGKYTLTSESEKMSYMQLEVDVEADDIISHKPEGNWLSTTPLRRISFDIECAGRKGIFPEPQHDSIIQIANYVWDYGKATPAANVVFTLKSCAPIVGADVLSFEEEKDMLAAWSRFMRVVDPDILTGYNIVNFDLPYMIERAEHLKVTEFPFLGRMIGQPTLMRKTKMSSSAFGTHDSRSFSMHGRVVFDMLQLITREYKLRSYSLNSVSAEFLGQQKEDVHYSIITDLQKGDEQTRRRLAVYCLKDAQLPMKLMDKLLSLTNYIEMARVTGIPLGWLVSRGHMIKVVSLLHRKSHAVNLLIPDKEQPRAFGGVSPGKGPQFTGATVIEPVKGFYRDPIATLDFASLYPSIIMAHNLCYSTLVTSSDISQINPADVSKSPTGAVFVKKSVKKGILTEMLEELLTARKQAKKELKEATDPFLKSVLNGRQLALKISANAVYGFTGAQVGKLPCMEISASTTAYGRQMIENTKDEVEKRYKASTVIYGDTDSVMVKFGAGKSLEECMKLGEEAAEKISNIFPKPVKLEFEKCYYPYLLISKKRYAGLTWTNTKNFEMMDCKGIESVRRDNCRLVANVISSVLELLLKKQDRNSAIEMVKNTISDLLQNKIDVSLLVVSKALTKADYENKQAHVELAKKLRKRDPGTAPSLGDRVPYVITKGAKNEPAYSRAEDPLYVLEHNIPIDNTYYLENMLRKPLERIFDPVMQGSTSSLFAGEHTRTISVVTPKTGGMMKFATVKLKCLGCKTSITSGAICKYCAPREAEIYQKHVHMVTDLEKVYSSLWTECQRCMGEICQDVLCSNGDCPIFYRRRKAQKDLDSASSKLTRFDLEW